jgi:hypothetical protein
VFRHFFLIHFFFSTSSDGGRRGADHSSTSLGRHRPALASAAHAVHRPTLATTTHGDAVPTRADSLLSGSPGGVVKEGRSAQWCSGSGTSGGTVGRRASGRGTLGDQGAELATAARAPQDDSTSFQL